MALAELYSKGVKIWIPDQNVVWMGATILEFLNEKCAIKIIDDNGKVTEMKLKMKINNSDPNVPFLRNPEILIGQKDLTSLSYLNEPEVLYNLQIRFCERLEIYTYCGIVLVAINPYQELSIYGNEIINAYHMQNSNNLDPHIFAVAENAFRRMSSFDENQSVIVSGESGAGKTVSAKYIMRYFALVGGSKYKKSSYTLNETQIERKVLSSNPLLEAMGNAKTIRNDNSSRFGKYLEILFNQRNQIVSASLCTYLLEKSRVVFQNLGERNYHIFYQIVSHCQSGDELLVDCGLVNNPETYLYLRYGESLEIDGVDDSQEFAVTKSSFAQMGIDFVHLKEIFQILAAILHLGNIRFQSCNNAESCTIENLELLKLISELLGCSKDQLKIWLCFRTISTSQETLHKPLSKDEAQYFRDALVKTIYSNLFDWIVKQVNKSLSGNVSSNGKKGLKKSVQENPVPKKRFIGVLDIYGFETFEENSFEQFCINFANEKLQLQFNMHVFKLEQEEYMKEGLEWTFIDYYNNQPCIDLIEAPLGLLDLLDEECKLLKGTDENWCCKIYSHHLNKSASFAKPKMSNSAFIIEHFAGQVQYECAGFIEKNRDTVLEEQINLLKASDVTLVSELFKDIDYSENTNANATQIKMNFRPNVQKKRQENVKRMKKTVGSQFKNSLRSLMDTLNGTNPHYIRCIKPNDLKLPFTFCPTRAVQQLRACGILETIRLSGAGFPSRWTYQEFYTRYYILLSRFTVKNLDVKFATKTIVETLIKNSESYRFGHNKLFFRSGQVAFLEKLRSEKIEKSVTLIQSIFRGSMQRSKYLSTLQLVLQVQCLIRRKFCLLKADNLRRKRASIRIQSFYRMCVMRNRFLKMKKSVNIIESWWSRILLAKKKQDSKRRQCAVLCQSIIRAYICRQRYLKIRRGIILIQNHYRRRKAKLQLKILKVEAKSLDHIKFVNKGLENKIIELMQKLDTKEKETISLQNKAVKEKKFEVEVQKQNQLEMSKTYQFTIQELQLEIIKLNRYLNKVILEKNEINAEKKSMEENYEKKILELESCIENMKTSAILLNDETLFKKKDRTSPDIGEQLIKEQMEHQNLILDYEKLEMRYDNLFREFAFMKSSLHKFEIGNLDSRSNFSENESMGSRDDTDMDSFSENQNSKTRKQKSNNPGKSLPNHFNEVKTIGNLAVAMQLQMRINSISQDNDRLKDRIQELEEQLLKFKYSNDNQVALRSQQDANDSDMFLLLQEIKHLDDHGFKLKLIEKIADLKKQVSFQTEEYQKLRRNMFSGTLGKLADDMNKSCNLMHCEELQMAYESQKEVNRKMLKEIEEVKAEEIHLKNAITQLRKEKDLLQTQIGKLGDLIGNVKLAPNERLDKFVQNEISRILIENLKLQEKNDLIVSETIQLKRGLKYFAFRLQKYEGSFVPNPSKVEDLLKMIENIVYNSKFNSEEECYSEVGLIDLNMSELTVFIKTFIYDLSPEVCQKNKPYHIIPYIIFLITRKFDVFKEEENLKVFLTKLISALKRIIKKRKDYIEHLVMWMSNALCLLNLFQQYNGSKEFPDKNTPDESKHNFRVYDLSVFIRLLKDLCITTFQNIMQYIIENLLTQSLCINAILFQEDIKILKSTDASKYKEDLEMQTKNTPFNVLMKNLQSILDILKIHHIPTELIDQIFVHIAYLINAYCLNTLLFNTDLCFFSKGIQIRYNLSSFENWLRYQKLIESKALQCLQPMTEAVQLLQTLLRTDDDAQIVCDMCDYLNTSQIIKILHNFNPRDGFGCRIPKGLICRVETLMKNKRAGHMGDNNLETPTKIHIPINIPFIHNDQLLDKIIIPRSLHVAYLKILTEKDIA